jgi:hypothetical protein
MIKVSQKKISSIGGTLACCTSCSWYLTIHQADGSVSVLGTEAQKHVRQTDHVVRRYVEDVTEYRQMA